MTVREKVAWLSFVVTAAALAAVVIARQDVGASVSHETRVGVSSDQTAVQLARIESRLARLEEESPAASPGAAPAKEPNEQTAALHPAAHEVVSEPDSASSATEQRRLEGAAIVDRAIRAGYWSRKDSEAWMAAAGGMRGEDRFELQRRLIVEVNADRLKVEPGLSIR